MKRTFFLFFIFLISNLLFSQNAYRNFNWSMTVDQVKTICPDLKKVENGSELGFRNIISHELNVIGVHLNTINIREVIYPPELFVDGNTYISQSNNLAFYFEDNKLRYINVLSLEDTENTEKKYIESIKGITRNDLINRFGNPVTHLIYQPNQDRRIVGELYINEQNRFIFTEVNYYSYWLIQIDKLIYIDKTWITQKFNNYFLEYKNNYNRRMDNLLN